LLLWPVRSCISWAWKRRRVSITKMQHRLQTNLHRENLNIGSSPMSFLESGAFMAKMAVRMISQNTLLTKRLLPPRSGNMRSMTHTPTSTMHLYF
jgi:hypothetical protein